jgi:hypothetical protein
MLAALLERLQYWSGGQLDATVARDVAAAPAAVIDEAIAAIPAAAAEFPVSTRYTDQPWFSPVNLYNMDRGAYRLCALAVLAGQRREVRAVDPLLEVVRTHASPDARIVAGHGVIAIGATTAIVEVADHARSWSPGWFRLWCGTQLANDRGGAFDAIADRLATSDAALDDIPMLRAAIEAARHHRVAAPRWAELAVRLLEHDPRDWSAREVLVDLGDHRVLDALHAELAHPNHNTVKTALEQLERLLGPAVVPAVLPAFARATHRNLYVDLFQRIGGPQAIAALRGEAARFPTFHRTVAATVAADPEAPAWMRLSVERRTSTLAQRAVRFEAEVRAVFATAPPARTRAAFASWVWRQPGHMSAALFELHDGKTPAWQTLLDRHERRVIRTRR